MIVLQSIDINVLSAGVDAFGHLQEVISTGGKTLAQVTDPDVLGQMRKAFQHFIESGQVWALIIGFVFGYGFKSLLPG